MKKAHNYLLIFLMPALMLGCRQEQTPRPLKFEAYAGNPVLSPGAPGEWDDLFLIGPYVYWHDSLYYMFYTGSNVAGKLAIGLATSTDGFHFTKYAGNPILEADGNGYDAWHVGGAVIIRQACLPPKVSVDVRQDSLWVMYFGSSEVVTYGPGPYIGRATAPELTGPWIRDEKPVLSAGKAGEWDGGYAFPTKIVILENGTYRMYYGGGNDFASLDKYFIGMASSDDGITWKKYNEPATVQHPYADSDPVLTDSKDGEWDDAGIFTAFVYQESGYFTMYYDGFCFINRSQNGHIGFAYSKDGIKWNKYSGNPIYTRQEDPYIANDTVRATFECPWLVFRDTVCLMYYDYGTVLGEISMATARLKKKK